MWMCGKTGHDFYRSLIQLDVLTLSPAWATIVAQAKVGVVQQRQQLWPNRHVLLFTSVEQIQCQVQVSSLHGHILGI